jgi:hypothetical protein
MQPAAWWIIGAWPLYGARNGLVQHLLRRSKSLVGRQS